MNKKTKKVELFKKAAEYITKSRLRRTTLGLSLCVGSLLYIIVLSDVTVKRNLLGSTLYFIDALAFIIGMLIFTNNHDKFTRIMNRGCLEIAGFILAAASVKGTMDALMTPFIGISGLKQFLIFAEIIYLTWYLIRLGRFIYRLINITLTKLLKLVRGKKVKNTTELIDVVLKNILSIAGTIALLYQAMEPLVNKILGI